MCSVGVCVAVAAHAQPAAIKTQNVHERLQQRWQQLTKAEAELKAEREAQLKQQQEDANFQRWHNLTEEKQQQLRNQREAAIRAYAQQRLNERRKGN